MKAKHDHYQLGVALSIFLLLTASALTRGATRLPEQSITQTDVFVSGTDGYHTFRIPSIIVSRDGTVLAFCEGRKKARGDSGNIDLVLRRSSDGGKTWGAMQVIWDDGPNTCGNPCPVVDRETGTIWLLMTQSHENTCP